MNKATELFDKILVDGQEINLQQLDANNGVYSAGSQKTIKVDFILKKKDEIPAKLFNGLTSLKTVVIPESVKTIGERAFASTGAEISGLKQVETFGEGALVGTIIDDDIKEQIPANAFVEYILIDSLNKFNEVKTNSTTSEILINNSVIINGIGDSAEYFKSIKVTGVDINSTVTIKTLDKIILDNITVSGEKGVRNGKITFATNSLELKNISVSKDSTIYNAFEGYQSLNDQNYTGIKQVIVKNMHIDCPSITHNIVNIYTPGEGCEILFKDCTFNLDVNNSNIIRLANYMNSSNVHVTFENVEWNYEEAANEQSDWKWAGLVIYQPASADTVLSGDTSKLATWTFTFKDCKYNGQIVTANNFGQHNQVVYLYNVGGSKVISDPTLIEGMTFNFINSENIVNGEVTSKDGGDTQIYNG